MIAARVDTQALLDDMRALAESAPAGGAPGVTRLAWSDADLRGREILAAIAARGGVPTATDAVGNVTADWPGTDPALRPLVIGSHIDSVVEAGPLDGAYGTAAAFEIVTALAEAREHLRHPVRAVAWVNEEGVVAPPFTGSLVATGKTVDLEAAGPDGVSLEARIRASGGSPERISTAAWAPIAGYLELHIEQGPVLDDLGVPIGVVTGITGDRRGTISVIGRANHAGTTPMHRRRNALLAALPLVTAIDQIATKGPVEVATVGSLVVYPGVGNVVPGRVEMTYDIRSLEDTACDEAIALLERQAASVAESQSVTVCLTPTFASAGVRTNGLMRQIVAEAAADLGLASVELASGAGHDAQNLAPIAPTGMIFVPSSGGISHQAAESTPPEQLAAGAQTLLAALRLADARLDPRAPTRR